MMCPICEADLPENWPEKCPDCNAALEYEGDWTGDHWQTHVSATP